MSFCEYLENERIKKACELLKARVAVKDVAEAVGYCSDFTFRRAFKRVMGLAPSYYAEGLEEK
ncbi:MAG: helix-turn-helix domain-containing protein [Lachnospiraceae bacterium]